MILVEVALISLFMSFLLVLLSKFLTNQNSLKQIRTEVEDYRKKIKEAKDQKNEAAVKDYTAQMFKTSGKQFKESRKSMMVSMVVGLIAIYVLQSGYTALSVNLEQGNIGGSPVLKGSLTDGREVVFYDSSSLGVDNNKNSVIEQDEKYGINSSVPYGGSYLKFKEPKDGKAGATIVAAKAPFNMPYFGYDLGWFAIYLFITLPTTLLLRKLLDVQ